MDNRESPETITFAKMGAAGVRGVEEWWSSQFSVQRKLFSYR